MNNGTISNLTYNGWLGKAVKMAAKRDTGTGGKIRTYKI